MFHLRLFLILALCGLRVQLAQAEPVERAGATGRRGRTGSRPWAGYLFVGLVVGYPLGVYLADPVESSFWMTYVGGYGLALGSVILGVKMGGTTAKASLVVAMGSPIMASELSRLLPKRYRNPNPFKWLFGKFRRPSPRVSFGLVPDLQRGLSARATLRF